MKGHKSICTRVSQNKPPVFTFKDLCFIETRKDKNLNLFLY